MWVWTRLGFHYILEMIHFLGVSAFYFSNVWSSRGFKVSGSLEYQANFWSFHPVKTCICDFLHLSEGRGSRGLKHVGLSQKKIAAGGQNVTPGEFRHNLFDL